MKNSVSEDKDFILWLFLRQTRDAIFSARQKELSQYGILHRQAAVLFIVHALGDRATPAELSRWLLRKPHTVSGILSRMEKQGLVRKVRDLGRKNLVRVALTEKGQQAYLQSMRRESFHKIMSCLSGEERRQLRSGLEKLRAQALKEIGMDHKPPFP